MTDKVSISLLIGGAVSASLLNSTDKAGKALSGLNQNLQKLKQAERSAKSLDGLQTSLEQTRQKLKSSSAETAKLAVAMRKVDNPSRELKRAFAAAKRESSALKTEFRSQVAAISSLRAELKAANVDTKNLGAAQVGLAANLNRVRAAQQRLAGAQAASAANRQQINSLYAQGLEAGALAFGLSRALRPAIQFESAMADVAKVVEFESTTAVREFGNELKSLSRQIPLTASELADIAASGGRLGLSAEQLPDFVSIVARMATAFDLLPAEAGDAIAKLSNIFDIPITDIERLGDAINQLANNTAARESDIVNVLTRVGGTSRQFGLLAKETAALADAFLALGRPPQIAATAINALLNKLQTGEAQSKKFQDGLASVGTSSEQLAAQIRSNPQRALLEFLQSLQRLDSQARAVVLTNLFGQEYSDDISILVGGLDEYRKALGLVADESEYVGGVQREFAKRAETTANEFKLLSNILREVAGNFGTALLPVFRLLSESLRLVSGAIADLVAAAPEVSAVIGTVVAAFIGWKVASVALRLSLALMKQPVLAVAEFLATIGAQSIVTATGLNTAAASATAASVATGKLAATLSRVSAILKGGGVIAGVAALVLSVRELAISMDEASNASKRVRENTDAYRDDLRSTMALYEQYADATIKSSVEIAKLSDRERESYEKNLDRAEQYWRARNLLEQDATGEVNKQSNERWRIALRGLRELGSSLNARQILHDEHAKKMASAKQAETAIIRSEFEKQKKIYDSEVSKLKEIENARKAFAKSIQGLSSTGPAPGSELIESTVLAPIRELQRGQSSLGAGEFQNAEASAKRVVEQLNSLKDAGKISQGLLTSLTKQANELGQGAFTGLEKQQEESIEAAKQKLQDLKSDFDFLQSLQIGVDEAGAISSVQSIRDKLQALVTENPIVVPVQGGVSGDVPKLPDVPGKAQGGPIVGPGPIGKDSVLMYGAPGEHMVTAQEVRAAGGHAVIYRLRQMLRQGLKIPGLANGGPVLPSVSLPQVPAFAGVEGGGDTLILNLEGQSASVAVSGSGVPDLKKLIKRERMKRGQRI